MKIILVNPSHPGNIGACARAMKNMEFRDLHLVAPKTFPHEQAKAMASGADDVLSQATVHTNLADAIGDCHYVIGTSARGRAIAIPTFTPRDFAQWYVKQPSTKKTAILFGRENFGLNNEELSLCHYHIVIPGNKTYNSLNLAQAVLLICYELFHAEKTPQSELDTHESELATHAEMHLFFDHLEQVLKAIEFIKPNVPNRIMPRLKRLFNRAACDKTELNILRGILTQIQR